MPGLYLILRDVSALWSHPSETFGIEGEEERAFFT